VSGFDRAPPATAPSAVIIRLDLGRARRGLPPPRDEAFLPPAGKRPGDPVKDGRGRRGTVVSHARRAIFGEGVGFVLAVQFPGTLCVLAASAVEPDPGPVVDETPLAAAIAAPAETEA